MKTLPNLYPLRLLLSLCVVIYHLPLISNGLKIPNFNDSPIFHKGTLAVFYFFTLSGFLILRLIYLEMAKSNSFDFKKFYLRRISRLYPVYYLVFIVGLVLYHYLLPKIGYPFEVSYSITDLILNYIFIIPNVFKYYHPDIGSILIVLWSIGVEEQFYLFIPILMYAFRKKLLLGIIGLLSVFLLLLIVYPKFYLYDNLYFYFILGGLLSILGAKGNLKFLNNRYIHFIVYILFIASFVTNFFEFKNFVLFHLFNLLVSGLLISIITDFPIFTIKSKIIDHLGKISYGIYMYHMIVITGVLFVVNKFKLYLHLNHTLFIIMLNVLVISLTMLVAHLSFRYFETLFYKAKH
jgi:peptidoglycan/LPS O-acetylase OafA/YrhL